MEFFEAVRTVLAVREFQDKPVPHDADRRIVESLALTSAANAGPCTQSRYLDTSI